MSTKGSIAGADMDDAFVHVYTECFDDHPQSVYIELWEQGRSMCVSVPRDHALVMADDMAKWAAAERAHEAEIVIHNAIDGREEAERLDADADRVFGGDE